MKIARITAKGQVTIPKKVRERLGISPGESIGFEERGGVFYIKKVLRSSPFDRWVGRLKHLRGSTTDSVIEGIRGR